MLSKAMMIQKPKILILKKTKKTSIRVYAVKSDDNPKDQTQYPSLSFTAMMAKDRTHWNQERILGGESLN